MLSVEFVASNTLKSIFLSIGASSTKLNLETFIVPLPVKFSITYLSPILVLGLKSIAKLFVFVISTFVTVFVQ